MEFLPIALATVGGLLFLILAVSTYCFFRVFYSPSRKPLGEDEYPIPNGEIYDKHRESMIGWMKQIRALPHECVDITSYDGLTLRGKLYEHHDGAPIEIMFHGYRGCAFRDMCGGVARAFALGRSALVVDQRASGESDGHVITFGVRERYDALSWAEYVYERFGETRPIILTGISMGAATVMMASALDLPKSVVGVLADCGYTSPRDIIMKVLSDMHLPPRPVYPFIKLGALIFGGFNPDSASAKEAVAKTSVPVIFYHGDADDFVPHEMSLENYEACASRKRMVTVEGAGHGLAFPSSPEFYVKTLREFFPEYSTTE